MKWGLQDTFPGSRLGRGGLAGPYGPSEASFLSHRARMIYVGYRLLQGTGDVWFLLRPPVVGKCKDLSPEMS